MNSIFRNQLNSF